MADFTLDTGRLRRKTLVVLVVALAALSPFVWEVLRPFLLSFLVASVGAIAIYPLHSPRGHPKPAIRGHFKTGHRS